MSHAARLAGSCLLMLLVGVPSAGAQTSGYIAGGIALFEYGPTPFFAAAGGDVVSKAGAGGGAEAGVFFDETGGVLAGLSLHAIVQPPPRGNWRIVPFASAGFAGFAGPEVSLGAWHVGGGMNWWSRPRIGARLEVRGYFGRGGYQRDRILLIRTALTFR